MLRPKSEEELAEAIAEASGPLRITGGGTRSLGAKVEGTPLSTQDLTGISLYEPGALTIVAAAGTPMAEIEAALAAENQRLPFEPMDHRGLFGTDGAPTIGGVVATNASGPRRVQAGACRDSLIGVRFVDGTGAAIKNGGRVMKNVTGYDLVKLMAGSFGTLGVLSEVAFKVLPGVAATRVLLVEGIGPDAAVPAMSKALGSPFEVSGAAYTSRGLDGAPVLMIRVEGFETSVEYRAGKLKDLLSGIGDIAIEADPVNTAAGWAWVRDASMFAASDGDIWRVSVKPTDGTAVVAALDGAPYLMDWGGGLIWAEQPAGTDLRARLAGISGHATLVRASDETKSALGVFHPEPAPLAAVSRGIRQKFDPRGILNPGLMG